MEQVDLLVVNTCHVGALAGYGSDNLHKVIIGSNDFHGATTSGADGTIYRIRNAYDLTSGGYNVLIGYQAGDKITDATQMSV